MGYGQATSQRVPNFKVQGHGLSTLRAPPGSAHYDNVGTSISSLLTLNHFRCPFFWSYAGRIGSF